MHIYTAWNGPMPTTASQQSVTTGTAIKTMMQLSTPSTRQIQLLAWGFSLESPPGGDGAIELLQTDVAATVTAYVNADVQNRDPSGPNSQLTLGTANSGYTASVEGSTTATRVFDVQSLSSTSGESMLTYSYQFTPLEQPIVAVSKFLRVRAYTPTGATNMRCWVRWAE